jgi:hypothetical protein
MRKKMDLFLSQRAEEPHGSIPLPTTGDAQKEVKHELAG